MTPKIAEIIKNALQIKDLGYGSAIGEAFFAPTISKGIQGYASKAVEKNAIKPAQEKIVDTFKSRKNRLTNKEVNERLKEDVSKGQNE